MSGRCTGGLLREAAVAGLSDIQLTLQDTYFLNGSFVRLDC